jgi:hypothetical protein
VPAFLPDSAALAIFLTGGFWSGPLCGVPNVKKPQATGVTPLQGFFGIHFGGPCNGEKIPVGCIGLPFPY